MSIKGKKVRVAVAFIGGLNSLGGSSLGGTKYYEGTVEAMNDNFLVFTDGNMIGIRYIQTIEVIG